MHLPTKALSIMQPWAGLIAAGKAVDREAMEEVAAGRHPVTGDLVAFDIDAYPRGGIIGVVDIVDCVTESKSQWFVGPYGFVLANARPLPFRPCRGMLGFFTPSAEKAVR